MCTINKDYNKSLETGVSSFLLCCDQASPPRCVKKVEAIQISNGIWDDQSTTLRQQLVLKTQTTKKKENQTNYQYRLRKGAAFETTLSARRLQPC
jgi:predicted ABC-type ATPase